MEFYKILNGIMQEKSMSIPDVSRSTGISDSTLRSILNRKTKSASLEVAFNIAKGLNVSLERLNGDIHIPAKELNFYLENIEIDLIKKYRVLNDHGKGVVSEILEYEYTYESELKKSQQNEKIIGLRPHVKEDPCIIAAHNDNTDPDQLELMRQDADELLDD